jgi:hypothetical protein
VLLVLEFQADPGSTLERGPALALRQIRGQLRLRGQAPGVGHIHRLQAGECLWDTRLDLVVGKDPGQGDLSLVEVDIGGLARGAGPPV